MNNKKFDVYFDFGSSKIRAVAFNRNDLENNFQVEKHCISDFTIDNSDFLNSESKIEEIILDLENQSNEYLDSIDLMIDSQQAFSVGLSVSKNFDGSKLKKGDVQFLIQDAKQQILRNYSSQKIIHIIIKNYKINKIDYDFLPTEINCYSLSIDIIFICVPTIIVDKIKKLFGKFNIFINQISFSSYAKSLNYKNNFPDNKNIAFIDMGYKKTSILYYKGNNISFFNIIPIGGNHITKDLSKILNIDLLKAEKTKLNFGKNESFDDEKNLPLELTQNIIFARIEEILELCIEAIRLNENYEQQNQFKMVLMGEGSKILDNKFKEKISFLQEINLLEEDTLSICESALKLSNGTNKQEVIVIPKKSTKIGFFEKFFYLFR